ncbi:hypothetical protein G5V59_09380 [Nocardioides sp. W3-2-3]|uniref:hypothetical protein n=1 Tax=Nocardioides convexus TaxID=2712224 RepID=UPI0024181BE4|nr:hypothetical protein [Nocardioides convexus]NHA00253.1 hypothetical protein [Nocardioides convexus]
MESDRTADLAAALTEAAQSINSHHSLDQTLDAIVRVAQQTVPGFDHVGISIVHGPNNGDGGRIETRAGTGSLVWEVDQAAVQGSTRAPATTPSPTAASPSWTTSRPRIAGRSTSSRWAGSG